MSLIRSACRKSTFGIVLVSLRILKLVLKQQPLSEVTRDANRLFYLGLSLLVTLLNKPASLAGGGDAH